VPFHREFHSLFLDVVQSKKVPIQLTLIII
jgi:hypothetical protein